MKKNKLNNKGFMIAELLVITVAILVIFTVIFSNFYPMMGEYEKREQYNNINATYATFYLKVFYLSNLNDNPSIEVNLLNKVASNDYVSLVSNGVCTNEVSSLDVNKCNDLVTNLDIEEMILTTHNITNLKDSYTGDLKTYIDYLPNYTDNGSYRLITKTTAGYATTSFYSKQCEVENLSEWSTYTLDSCNVLAINTCQTSPIYVKIGDWTTMVCDDSSSTCERTTLYQTVFDWSIDSCDPNESTCESRSGYLVQKREETGTTECGNQVCDTVSRTCNTYAKETVYQCTSGETTSSYDTLESCNSVCSVCESAEVNTSTCEVYNSCPDGYTLNTSENNCRRCYYSSVCKTYSDWDEGYYATTCVEDDLTRCSAATIYRILGSELLENCPSGQECISSVNYRTLEICDDPLENCCSDSEVCEQKNGYRTRTSATNLLDLNSPYVSPCN